MTRDKLEIKVRSIIAAVFTILGALLAANVLGGCQATPAGMSIDANFPDGTSVHVRDTKDITAVYDPVTHSFSYTSLGSVVSGQNAQLLGLQSNNLTSIVNNVVNQFFAFAQTAAPYILKGGGMLATDPKTGGPIVVPATSAAKQ